MQSGWTASGGVEVRRSNRCKAKWMYGTGWSDSKAAVQAEHWLNLARSRETDHDGYENRSPVFSYERSPNNNNNNIHISILPWVITSEAVRRHMIIIIIVSQSMVTVHHMSQPRRYSCTSCALYVNVTLLLLYCYTVMSHVIHCHSCRS